MKVFVERKNELLEIKFSGKARSLLKTIGMNPEEVLVVRNGELITLDEDVTEKDEVKLLSVISGG